MMHGFLSNLTAALLALHTVLGCCWHHVHRGGQECATTVCAESPDSCDCDHANGGAASDSTDHHSRHDCQGSRCVFVNCVKAGPHKPALQLEAPPSVAASYGGPSVCDNVGGQPFYPPDALLPPLRLHLAHQVLLI